MSTDVTYCPAPGCGRRVHGDRCECGWAAPGAAPAPPAEGDDERRRCPDCAEWIMAAARVCRFCSADLERAAKKGRPPSGRRRSVTRHAGKPAPAARALTNDAPFAAVMSLLIPGLGQLYAGATARGAFAFFMTCVLGGLAAASGGGYLFTVAWLAVGMWSSVDAYVVASRR